MQGLSLVVGRWSILHESTNYRLITCNCFADLDEHLGLKREIHIHTRAEFEETEYFHEKKLQVSIFMSPFNVHANWYPIEGNIIVSEHQKGRHMGAWLPKSSTENERSLVVIETPSKVQIAIRQIAGAMARRIVTYAKAGHMAHRNTHLGFIKLGSRVDMYLPLNTEMFVEVGEAVTGNETIIGRLSDNVKELKS